MRDRSLYTSAQFYFNILKACTCIWCLYFLHICVQICLDMARTHASLLGGHWCHPVRSPFSFSPNSLKCPDPVRLYHLLLPTPIFLRYATRELRLAVAGFFCAVAAIHDASPICNIWPIFSIYMTWLENAFQQSYMVKQHTFVFKYPPTS